MTAMTDTKRQETDMEAPQFFRKQIAALTAMESVSYVSVFHNEHGEPWIFYVQDDHRRVTGSEVDWDVVTLPDTKPTRRIPGMIMDEPECLWMLACTTAVQPAKPARPKREGA